MEREKSGFGFGKDKIRSTEETDGFIGEFVFATHNGNNVYGILAEIKGGYAYFKPSIIQYADNTLYIEEKLPSRLVLPLAIIYPIKGSLEEYVEIYNANLEKDKTKK